MKKNYTIFITGLVMATVFVMLPTATFAKHNDDGGKKERGELKVESGAREDADENLNREENEMYEKPREKSCFRAIGHLIAPGWFKHNGDINLDLECDLPFGIAKKFRGNNASSTPDVTAPAISAIIFRAAKKQVEVRWFTNEKSDSAIFWSTTTPVSQSGTSSDMIVKNRLENEHKIIIRHLNPNTTYYMIVRSRDSSGNTSSSDTLSFTTKSLSIDSNAPVISSVATLTGTSTIQVIWRTNEQSTGRVYYSPTLPAIANASSTSFVGSDGLVKNHILMIPNLANGTIYYLVIESTDSDGNVSTSATFSATTGPVITPPDVTPPVISSLVATTTSASTANITWTTNEPATSKVFYSTTTPVNITASTTPFVANSSLVTSHSLTISSLVTSTLYHLIVQTADGVGNISTSSELSLTTGI